MMIGMLEDDQELAGLIEHWLAGAGHEVCVFHDGSSLMQALRRSSFEMLLLDWEVPEMDGFELLQWVRRNLDWKLPVIFMTARDEESDIVAALTAGADDYLTKPLTRPLLLARLRAVARRAGIEGRRTTALSIEPFEVDFEQRQILRDGESVQMTKRELDLALFLFQNVNRVLSRDVLLRAVWGIDQDLNTRTVDTHMSRVRGKLGLQTTGSWILKSVYHFGYRLEHQ